MKVYRITKREAWLLLHMVKNFPMGASEQTLAESLGWSLRKVLATLEACAACGLMAGPGPLPPGVKGIPLRPGQVVADLLTRKERRQAEKSMLR